MSSPPGFDPRKMIPDPNFTVPDLSEAVEGWRTWRVEEPAYGVGPKLFSVSHSSYYWWPRKAAEAECIHCAQWDDVPGQRCSCGFYSARTLEHLLSMSYHFYNSEYGQWGVVGQVANWGRVVPGDQGWRSQFSYPVCLYVPFEAARILGPALQETYGVKVKMLNVLKPHPNLRRLG